MFRMDCAVLSTISPKGRWQVRYCAVSALVLAGFLTACSLNPEARGTDADRAGALSATTILKTPELSGKVRADEFNDQATGKDIPADGGQLVVRFNAEPQTLSPWLSTADTYSSYISTENIYDTLLWQNRETFELEPNL